VGGGFGGFGGGSLSQAQAQAQAQSQSFGECQSTTPSTPHTFDPVSALHQPCRKCTTTIQLAGDLALNRRRHARFAPQLLQLMRWFALTPQPNVEVGCAHERCVCLPLSRYALLQGAVAVATVAVGGHTAVTEVGDTGVAMAGAAN
jgi:hypothetical protein